MCVSMCVSIRTSKPLTRLFLTDDGEHVLEVKVWGGLQVRRQGTEG